MNTPTAPARAQAPLPATREELVELIDERIRKREGEVAREIMEAFDSPVIA